MQDELHKNPSPLRRLEDYATFERSNEVNGEGQHRKGDVRCKVRHVHPWGTTKSLVVAQICVAAR